MKRALIFLLFSFSFLITQPAIALEKGDAAPDFKLSTIEGEKVRLSDLKGGIVILKLATTWCPTCKQQNQEIAAIGEFLKEKDVTLVEVFLQDSETMIREYLKETNLPIRHLVLEGNNKVAQAYNVYVIPRVLILDRELRVCRDGSLISAGDLKKELESLVGDRN